MFDDAVTIESLGGEVDIADPVEIGDYATDVRLLRGVAGPAAADLVRSVARRIAQQIDEP